MSIKIWNNNFERIFLSQHEIHRRKTISFFVQNLKKYQKISLVDHRNDCNEFSALHLMKTCEMMPLIPYLRLSVSVFNLVLNRVVFFLHDSTVNYVLNMHTKTAALDARDIILVPIGKSVWVSLLAKMTFSNEKKFRKISFSDDWNVDDCFITNGFSFAL